MEPDVDNQGIDSFLAAHDPVDPHAAFAPGEMFGDWRVTAFLGRGGSGEVYRVVHTTLGTSAALKMCVRRADRDSARDKAVCARFRHEAELLAKNKHPAFPRFFGFGERDGRPWYVMELLEYRPLPTTGREIARFLLAVAAGVRHLHSIGLIHRDIKPGNILWRTVGSRVPRDRECDGLVPQMDVPVLIDLGLVKDTSAVRGHVGESFSIVDGQALGVGTPRYAAPEQMSGDDVSPATDVYALGMLANDCFGGKPPRAWRRIIQRATAAIPAQRYANVDAFANAIQRMMLWKKAVRVAACLFGGMAIAGLVAIASRPPLPYNMILDGKKVVITKPVVLTGGKTYTVTGPGTLDADISGPSNAVLKLKNCVVLNRTKRLYPENGLQYDFDDGVYLNFVNIKEKPLGLSERDFVGAYDGAYNDIRFGGPETLEALNRTRNEEAVREIMKMDELP
jgi:serine/threonine protein kinase